MGNKLIPIIVVILFVVVAAIGMSSRNNSASIPDVANEKTENADGDTTVNTLETLVAQVKALSEQQAKDRELILTLNERNSELQADIDLVRTESSELDTSEIEANVLASAIEEVNKLKPNQGGDSTWGSEFDEFDGEFDIGSGISNEGSDSGQSPRTTRRVHSNSSNKMVVLGGVRFTSTPKSDINSDRESVKEYINSKEETSEEDKEYDLDNLGRTKEFSEGIPLFTIPQLAMDVNAETLTAVIGRIPNSGELRDPFYFKVISSADIVTANGYQLPELAGILWEGTARGDRTLGCTTGQINKVSLVHYDGSIIETNIGGSQSGKNDELAYIADKYGQPCLPGKLISNAGKLLTARVTVAALEAAAAAEAARQETISTNPSNDTTSTTVTGSRSKYIRAQTATGGLNELVEFARERMREAFDAIYVEPGVPIQIHLRRQIEFNFKKDGRQLVHNTGGKLNASYFAD